MADEAAFVLEQVRSAMLAMPMPEGKRLGVLDSPMLAHIVQMLLGPSPYSEIVERFAAHGVKLSSQTLRRLRHLANGLDDGLKTAVVALPPIAAGAHKKEESVGLTSVQVLKKTIASITGRIAEIEEEIKAGKTDKNKVVSDKREDQLMKYYEMVVGLRKDLEQERLKSEVVQAYRQGAVAICMIAVDFIKDDEEKRKFLEKVRELEQRDL